MLPIAIIGAISVLVWMAWELKNAPEWKGEYKQPPPAPDIAAIRRHNLECWQEEIREDISQAKWRLKL